MSLRRLNLFAGFRATLGLCVTCVGCQFAPLAQYVEGKDNGQVADRQPAAAGPASKPNDITLASSSSAAYTVQAGDVLHWSLVSSQRLPNGLVGGKSRVNDDGRIALGRYGNVTVGGLTPEQARVVLENYLSSQMHNSQLHVQLTAQTDNPRAVPEHATLASASEAPTQAPAAVPPAAASVPINPPRTIAWHSAQNDSAGKPGLLNRFFAQPEKSVHPGVLAASPAVDRGQGTITRVSWQPVAQAGDGAPGTLAPSEGKLPPNAATALEMPTKLDHAALPMEVGHPPVPRELDKISLPPYVIEPPDVLLVESTKAAPDQPIQGQHLVRPDGTIGLGIYGSVYVAGMTLDQAKAAIEAHLSARIKQPEVSVDVIAYNSKVYYVITDGGGYGEQVTRFPVTGNETVLDAIGLINGLPPVASKKIWIARRSSGGGPGCPGQEIVLPVDWCAITQHGITDTNFQVMPGDRIYVKADRWRTFDACVAKVLSPFERMFGFTLLGGATYNTISGRNTGSGTSGLAR